MLADALTASQKQALGRLLSTVEMHERELRGANWANDHRNIEPHYPTSSRPSLQPSWTTRPKVMPGSTRSSSTATAP
jgi:hypothetical protein